MPVLSHERWLRFLRWAKGLDPDYEPGWLDLHLLDNPAWQRPTF